MVDELSIEINDPQPISINFPTGLNIFKFFINTINPSSTTGNDGDVYLNNITFDLFKKIDGTWIYQGNIQGLTETLLTLNGQLDVNLTYSGIIEKGTGGVAITAGQVCYVGLDGYYYPANASSIDTVPATVMSVQDTDAFVEGRYLRMGYLKNNAWDLTPGPIYLDTVDGGITNTYSNNSTYIVEVLGESTEPTVVFFNPNQMFIQLT